MLLYPIKKNVLTERKAGSGKYQSNYILYFQAMDPAPGAEDLVACLTDPGWLDRAGILPENRVNLVVSPWSMPVERFPEPPENYSNRSVLKSNRLRKAHFTHQNILWFDVDSVGLVDAPLLVELVEDFFNEGYGIELNESNSIFIHSGRGVHFLFQAKEALIQGPGHHQYDPIKGIYSQLCQKLQDKIQTKIRTAKVDSNPYFSAQSTIRIPNTVNDKGGGNERPVKLIREGNLDPINFFWDTFSPLFDEADFIQARDIIMDPSPKQLADVVDPVSSAKVDVKGVCEECPFMVHCREKAKTLPEPEWRAMLSIFAFMPSSAKSIAKSWSKPHPGYSEEEFEEKFSQVQGFGKPYTCESIDNIWGNCEGCQWEGKIKTPLQITRKEFYPSEKFDFWNIKINDKGHVVPVSLCYEDLIKKFCNEKSYRKVEGAIYKKLPMYFDVTPQSDFEYDLGNFFYNTPKDYSSKQLHRSQLVELQTRIESDERFVLRGDLDPIGKMNFRNGVLNFENGTFRERKKNDYFSHVFDFDYDEKAKAPVFERFLDQVTLGEKEMQECILQFFGYVLAGGTPKYEKAMVLFGDGANGKSALINILKEIVGAKFTGAAQIREICRDKNTRFSLIGKLMNVCSEVNATELLGNDIFKALVSGEAVEVKQLYKDAFMAKLKAKIIFATNHLPYTSDHSDGFHRRFLLMDFKYRIPERDRDVNIVQKMRVEIPGITNLLIEAYKRLEYQGEFTIPQTSKDLQREHQLETDPIAAFLDEKVEVVEDMEIKTTTQELYNELRTYCSDSGIKSVPTLGRFSKHFKKKIPNGELRHYRNKAERGYKGVKLIQRGVGF